MRYSTTASSCGSKPLFGRRLQSDHAEAQLEPPPLSCLLACLQIHHQVKYCTAYRQVGPTKLDNIKNLSPEIQVDPVGWGCNRVSQRDGNVGVRFRHTGQVAETHSPGAKGRRTGQARFQYNRDEAGAQWSSKTICRRSGWMRGSIFWAVLVWGQFRVSKTIIPEAQEHFLTPSARRYIHLFGGLGVRREDGPKQWSR